MHFVQAAFDPAGIEFNTFPTMAKHIVNAMLPEQDGKVHKLSLNEGSDRHDPVIGVVAFVPTFFGQQHDNRCFALRVSHGPSHVPNLK